MKFILPELPVFNKSLDALSPFISKETMEVHYHGHHKKYVDELNHLIEGTRYEGRSLEDIIRASEGALYNNAAQAWNHTFYWYCLKPKAGGPADGVIGKKIQQQFGSFENFKSLFTAAAVNLFGSGWVWLATDTSGNFSIEPMSNAGNPLTIEGLYPVLVCDVWEHAYYLDHKNNRDEYMDGFWNAVNWRFAEACYEKMDLVNMTKLMTPGNTSKDELEAIPA